VEVHGERQEARKDHSRSLAVNRWRVAVAGGRPYAAPAGEPCMQPTGGGRLHLRGISYLPGPGGFHPGLHRLHAGVIDTHCSERRQYRLSDLNRLFEFPIFKIRSSVTRKIQHIGKPEKENGFICHSPGCHSKNLCLLGRYLILFRLLPLNNRELLQKLPKMTQPLIQYRASRIHRIHNVQ
jgi:hypothetical protein